MIGIYKIQNKVNNKVYIGQSQNIEARWQDHKWTMNRTTHHSYNYPLYRAFRKYGLDNFEFSVIEECSLDELTIKEQYWINYYNALDPTKGYNLVNAVDAHSKENSNWAKLTEKEVKTIIDLIKTTELLFTDLAEMYHVSSSCIEDINKGQSWIYPDIDYPIRKNGRNIAHQGENQNTAKLTNAQVLEIRQRYVNETIETIYEDYKDIYSFSGFKKLVYGQTWKHLPYYKKSTLSWYLSE